MAVAFTRTVPILRMFSVEKAREFYLDYLGFTVNWEHRFEPGTPLNMEIMRDGLTLHLSEHHGDGVPGTTVYVTTSGVDEYHRELTAKNYGYLRPSVDDTSWGSRGMTLIDPFGNKLRLDEPNPG